MIRWPDLRSEQAANQGWHCIRRLSALFLKKVLGRLTPKCMMCAIASGVVAECQTKNKMYKSASIPTQEMEYRLDSLLREANEASDAARQSRLWASPQYVAEAHAHADKAWEKYWLAKSQLEEVSL